MKTALKIFGLILVTVIVLSIQVDNRTLFSHIYKVISPATQGAQEATENFFDRSIQKTNRYSKKLFDNSVPQVSKKMGDSVKSKMSAVKKTQAAPLEHIKEEEQRQLSDLIESHN